eukprot:scaffold247_cov172-Ochromonas_danica.AAC.31
MKALEHYERPAMKPMAFFRHLVAYVTLGLLCGWYYFLLLLLYPTLFFFLLRGSATAATVIATLVFLTFSPIKHKVWPAFLNHWIWGIWLEYFDFSYEISAFSEIYDPQEKYLFLEFPHGVFPMGQFLSSAIVHKITPGKLVVGAAADAVFAFPVIRQVLSWIGTFPAHSKNIHEVLSSGMNCTIIVGGIAEMYLMNSSTESIYFRKRLNSVKIAIKEGAHIVPGFFFGNTRLFEVIGGGRSDSWLSQVSRRIRASILFFYGRHFLPVPYRHPIHMVAGEIVRVQQNDNPSDEEAQKVLLEVIRSVERLYEEKRPPWESRPLVIV